MPMKNIHGKHHSVWFIAVEQLLYDTDRCELLLQNYATMGLFIASGNCL